VKLKLIVIVGKKAGMEIPIHVPKCFIGRGDDCHIRPQSQLVKDSWQRRMAYGMSWPLCFPAF
jgi:hypothetical protein